jgi:hypothetical protein
MEVNPWSVKWFRSQYCSPQKLAQLRATGFVWVRPIVQTWQHSLRNPTVGRPLEFTTMWQPGAVHVNTREAQRLFGRLCY